MKKLALLLSLLVLASFAFTLSADPAPEAASQKNEAAAEELTPAPAQDEESAPAMCQAAAGMFPGPNYCGDPCDVEGQTVGCIDTSGSVWVRTMCYCSNGTLVC